MKHLSTLLAAAAMAATYALPLSPAYAADCFSTSPNSPRGASAEWLSGAPDCQQKARQKFSERRTAAPVEGYKPVVVSCPVMFYGDRVSFGGQEYTLDERAPFVDGQLSDDVVSRYEQV